MSAVAVAVRERPVIFADDSVRAILDGRKTQTRRVVGPTVRWCPEWARRGAWLYGADRARTRDVWSLEMTPDVRARMCTEEAYGWGVGSGCPYGVPGDRLWVREAFWHHVRDFNETTAGRALGKRFTPENIADARGRRRVSSLPDHDCGDWCFVEGGTPAPGWRKYPAMFMPRWASRLTLEVTEVRVQRLQMITAEDARAEGFPGEGIPGRVNGEPATIHYFDPRVWFAHAWNAINVDRRARGGAGFAWAENPWVWAITFRRLHA